MQRQKLKKITLYIIILSSFLLVLYLGLSQYIQYRQYKSTHPISELASIKNNNELKVGVLRAVSPYYLATGRNIILPHGFDYELARLFADYLGVQIQFIVKPNIRELFKGLKNGEYDIITNGLYSLPQRQVLFRATPPYYDSKLQLVYLKGHAKPLPLLKLKGTLLVSTDSVAAYLLKQLQHNKQLNNGLIWKTASHSSMEDLIREVANGKLDYTIADSLTISLMQLVYPNIAVAYDITDKMPINWYVNRVPDNSLYQKIQDFFEQSANDGTLARLESNYLSYIGDFDFVDTRSFITAIKDRLPNYERFFRKYSKNKSFDWKLLAVVSYQESHWNPQAVSKTGVRGMMMLTQATAKSLGITNRTDPEQSISGGANYLQQLIDRIPESIPVKERIWFALASYNMGYGHMMDARMLTQQQGADPNNWADVKLRLPLLSDKKYYIHTQYGYARGYQAYNFIENIQRYLVTLSGYLFEKRHHASLQPFINKNNKKSSIQFQDNLMSLNGTKPTSPLAPTLKNLLPQIIPERVGRLSILQKILAFLVDYPRIMPQINIFPSINLSSLEHQEYTLLYLKWPLPMSVESQVFN